MVLKANDDASARDFPQQWYDAASEDHFWMEWRARVLSERLDPMAALSTFDIGCGHGAVQRQLARSTVWIIDGCDLNDVAIARLLPKVTKEIHRGTYHDDVAGAMYSPRILMNAICTPPLIEFLLYGCETVLL